MLCRSVVLNVATRWLEFFYPKMLPWVHYVPLRGDASDAAGTLEFLRANDDIAQAIADNGYRYIVDHLTMDSVRSVGGAARVVRTGGWRGCEAAAVCLGAANRQHCGVSRRMCVCCVAVWRGGGVGGLRLAGCSEHWRQLLRGYARLQKFKTKRVRGLVLVFVAMTPPDRS